jgi:hypothetical protein
MKYVVALLGGLIAILAAMPSSGQMMMNPAYGMGGGRRTMINLISPASSPTQIARGTLMLGASTGANSMPALRLTLRLQRVSNSAGPVTSTANRLLFNGRLQSGSGTEEPIAIDEAFDVNAGVALVKASVDVSTTQDQATIVIDQIAVVDANGTEMAVPGILIASPASAPPGSTPGAACTQDSDCDDGDPNTPEVCTLFGCRQMSMHGGPSTIPTPGSGPHMEPDADMGPGTHMGGPMM